MNDQASALREAILRPRSNRAWHAMTIVVLAGKGGVGTSTVSANLAVAIAKRNCRVCLFDADVSRFDVAHLVGLASPDAIPERIHPRDDWSRNLPKAAGGVYVASATQFLDMDQRRQDSCGAQLARRLTRWEHGFDVMVVDVGCQQDSVVHAWSETAEQVLVVVAPDTVAVLNGYSLLKRLSAHGGKGVISVVINQVFHPDQATECEQRLRESTQRFLGRAIPVAGQIPFDPRLADGYSLGVPVVVSSPKVPSARAIERLAERMTGGIRRVPSGTSASSIREPFMIYQKSSSGEKQAVDEG